MRAWVMRITFIAIVTTLAVVGGAWWWVGRGGATHIEAWARQYLLAALARNLNARAEIGTLDYEYPRTLIISNFRLLDNQTPLLVVERLRLDLAEIPRRDKPLLIDRIELDGPDVHLIALEHGGLRGWSHLAVEDAARSPESVEAGYRVSDFLRLRHGEIRGGAVTYDPGDGRPPMTLRDITANLDTPPAGDGPEWYKIVGTLAHPQLADVQIDSRVNIDTGELDIQELKLEGALDSEHYRAFPPGIQEFLRTHAIAGKIVVSTKGRLPLANTDKAQLESVIDLRDGRFTLGDQALTTDHIHADVRLADEKLDMHATGDMFGGSAAVDVVADLTEHGATNATIRLSRIDAAQAIRLLPADVRDHISSLDVQARVSGTLTAAATGHDFAAATFLADTKLESLAFAVNGTRVQCAALALAGAIGAEQIELTAKSERIEFDRDGNPLVAESVDVKFNRAAGTTQLSGEARVSGGKFSGFAYLHDERPGALDINVTAASIDAQLLARVWPEASAALPIDASGKLSARVEGRLQTPDWAASDLRGDVQLDAGALRIADGALPFQKLAMLGTLREGQFDLQFMGKAADGALTCRVALPAHDPRTIQIDGDARDISAAQVVALAGSAAAPRLNFDGRFTGKFSIAAPLHDQREMRLHIDGKLRDAYCRIADVRIPIQTAELQAGMSRDQITWKATLDTLGGRVLSDGSSARGADESLSANWQVDNVELGELYSITHDGAASPYRGRLRGRGHFQVELARWPQSLRGTGSVEVDQGKLITFPVLGQLVQHIDTRILNVKAPDDDRGSAAFELQSDAVRVRDLDVSCKLLAIRGDGHVYYDKRLQLTVHANALPKLLELLGPLGGLLEKIGDRAVEYRVHGTIDDPHFETKPLGLDFPSGR